MKRRSFLTASGCVLGAFALGGFYWPSRWRYIIIHHSGGDHGSVPFLKRVHRERQPDDPINAIPYHYIIGNGNGLEDGRIDSDERMRYRLWGAHVSGNNMDRNFRGIGICIIGNLEKAEMTEKQYVALVDWTRKLMAEYSIPKENVTGHGQTPGEATLCPGKNFPMAAFKRDIV